MTYDYKLLSSKLFKLTGEFFIDAISGDLEFTSDSLDESLYFFRLECCDSLHDECINADEFIVLMNRVKLVKDFFN